MHIYIYTLCTCIYICMYSISVYKEIQLHCNAWFTLICIHLLKINMLGPVWAPCCAADQPAERRSERCSMDYHWSDFPLCVHSISSAHIIYVYIQCICIWVTYAYILIPYKLDMYVCNVMECYVMVWYGMYEM